MAQTVESTIQGFAERSDDQDIVALASSLSQVRREKEIAAFVQAAVASLSDKDKKVQSGCIKLLYEIGYQNPSFIESEAETFLNLLKSRNNRLAWGGMIALSTIALSCPKTLFERRQDIFKAIERGSTITQDRGIMTLGQIASNCPEYRDALFPSLLAFLKGSEKKDFPKFCEHILPAVDSTNSDRYIRLLESRIGEFSGSALARVEKSIKKASKA